MGTRRRISHALAAGALILAMAVPSGADARGGGHAGGHSGAHGSGGASIHSGSHGSHSSYGAHGASSPRSSSGHSSRAYAGVKRDGNGRIERSPHAKEAFRRTHPCPSTGKTYGACPGWVVDHVRALKHGGADDVSNMQWQTRAAAKAKDRLE
jgi:hypothetical protein